MQFKDLVLASVDPVAYYKTRFPKWDARSNVVCCFHSDSSPSLALNLSGGGARCHASSCGQRFGNIVHFEAKLTNASETLAAKRLYMEFVQKTLPISKLNDFKKQLLSAGPALKCFLKDTGLTIRSCLKFQIGYDPKSHRFVFPVFDAVGGLVNFRYYKTPSMRKGDAVKIYNEKGYGTIELFPWNQAKSYDTTKPIFLMASERESMLAIEHGLQAFSSTAGEGSWSDYWNQWLQDYHLIICLDTDKGGVEAATKLATQLATFAKSVKVVTLPLRNPKHKDFADWVLKENGNPKQLIKLVPQPKVERASSTSPVLPSMLDGFHDLISISSRAELLGKRIKTSGIVSAKSTLAYTVPWKFKVRPKGRSAITVEIPIGRDLVRFVRASDNEIMNHLSSIVGNQIKDMEILAHIPVSEVEVIPLAVADRDSPYVVQRCYYVGPLIEANVPYDMEIVPIAEVRSQNTVGVITKLTPIASTVDAFTMTKQVRQQLTAFKGKSTWKNLARIANEVAVQHTRIYDRLDWHLIALLTWLSPLQFKFPNEPEVQRGWMNSLAIGDTQTGKSKVAQRLTQLFECGVFVNAENCTYVGLVGGAIKMDSGKFGLRWGRLPLGDRKLVVLEELTGMSVQDIANMSEVRSAGIARLDKGGISGETNARTRLLCLSNPRSTMPLSGYIFGVKALQQLIGHGEDLARFDLMTTLTDGEVSLDTINSTMVAEQDTIPKESYAALAKFAWGLKVDQVLITAKAADACLTETKRLAELYHPSVPIFKGGSGRFKLARIANAIAVLCFSWSQTKQKLVVKATHVRAAAKLLELCYNKPSFGYGAYSNQLFSRDKLIEVSSLLQTIRAAIKPQYLRQTIDTLLHASRFTRDELCAFAGVSNLHADQIISAMVRSHALRKGEANVWEITPAGKKWLEQL